MEPDTGLSPRTLSSWPKLKSRVRHLAAWATQAPSPVFCLFVLFLRIYFIERKRVPPLQSGGWGKGRGKESQTKASISWLWDHHPNQDQESDCQLTETLALTLFLNGNLGADVPDLFRPTTFCSKLYFWVVLWRFPRSLNWHNLTQSLGDGGPEGLVVGPRKALLFTNNNLAQWSRVKRIGKWDFTISSKAAMNKVLQCWDKDRQKAME